MMWKKQQDIAISLKACLIPIVFACALHELLHLRCSTELYVAMQQERTPQA
jgi:hypothetical protein